jgi:uracil-DNA glycosylase family 4
MTHTEEFREILNQVKSNIHADMEMGLESPFMPDLFKGSRETSATGAGSLDELERSIGDCRRCKLYSGRTRIVFGEGNPRARLVFIGEGPGREEDLAGRPFVGEAGKLLTRIIEGGMGLKREDVYICNIVKCRPPDNRPPERDETEACIPFLKEQIRIIRPEIICTLGRTAAQELLARDFKITEERGGWRSFTGIPVMPTYHPAYIVRNPSREKELKGQVWEDVKKIMTKLRLEVKK